MASLPDRVPRGGIERYAPALAAAALLVALPIYFAARGSVSEWNDCFYRAARHLAAREPIHAPQETYAYPPSMAFWSVPWCYLPLRGSLFVWGVINAGATIVMIRSAWRLSGGGTLTALDRPSSWMFWGGLALASRWVIAPLAHQQYDMVIAALLMVGLEHLSRRRDARGGALLGLATSMKCTPLLFAPYLAWRGRWWAAVILVVVAVGVNVLPDAMLPQRAGGSYLVDWSTHFLGGISQQAPGTWHSDIILNQSLGGLFQRWARFGVPARIDIESAAVLTSEQVRLLKWLTYGTGLLLLGIVALAAGAPWRSYETRDDTQPRGAAGPSLPLEASAVLCLMLLLSPMSGKAHYVILLLPCWVFLRALSARRTLTRQLVLGALIVTGPLSVKGLVGKTWGDLTLMWGFPTLFVLTLLGALVGLLWERRLTFSTAEPIVPAAPPRRRLESAVGSATG